MRRPTKAEREALAAQRALDEIYMPHPIAEGTIDFAEMRRRAFKRDRLARPWLLRYLQHFAHVECRWSIEHSLAKRWRMPVWLVRRLLEEMTRELALDVLVGAR